MATLSPSTTYATVPGVGDRCRCDRLNAGLEELQAAVSDGDLPAAAEAATTLRGFVATL